MAPIWRDVLDQTARVCLAHGRSDLAQRLQRKRAQLLAPTLRVLVMGEPRQGKSQLVNALINAPACPVGDGLTTAIPTVVHHAETPVAALVSTPAANAAVPAQRNGSAARTPGRTGAAMVRPAERTPVTVAEIATRISARSTRGPGAGALHAEVGLPRDLLAAGLVLVDTPGLDRPGLTTPALAGAAELNGSGLNGSGLNGSGLNGTVEPADVVVMVSDATRELSTTEVDRLAQLAHEHPYVVVALTKIDIVPRWRQVAERNRQRLATAGVPAPLIPVSSLLRLRAAQANDKAINAESGFPDLIARLMRYLRAKPEVLAPTSAGLLVGRVIEQLAEPLRAGLSAEGGGEPLAKLHEAQRALDDLRRCSTSWQNSLTDQMTDLRSDIEHDLRERTRQILREADEVFETADPQRSWDDFQPWLEQALTEATEANVSWLVERCDWIAGQVADHFVPYGADTVPEWTIKPPQALGDPVTSITEPTFERFTLLQKAYTGLRGSYIGVLMFGLATTFAGMSLLNPISIGAGVLFAGKSIRDESTSLRKRRQATAKAAVQRHVDDVFFHLNKEIKDTIYRAQRTLRDHFTALTEQIHDDIVHSLRTAKQAADADVAERDQRHRDIQQQIRRLASLYERAQTLAASESAPALAKLESRA